MLVEHKEFQEKDGSLGYIESIFESDNVLKSTYFPNNKRLYITFSRGDTYSYANIDKNFYDEFEKAESQGKFFYKNINKNKTYPYRKEFTLYPSEVKGLKLIVENNKKIIEENKDEEDE